MSEVSAPAQSPAWRIDACLDSSSMASVPSRTVAAVDGGLRLTYPELRALVDRYAEALVAVGVRPGDRVAVLGHSSVRSTATLLAVASIGAAYVGLNPKYTARELRHILEDAGPALVVSLVSTAERVALTAVQGELAQTVPTLDLLSATGEAELARVLAKAPPGRPDLSTVRADVHEGLPAVILYTSGSTGAPKGVLLSHHSLCGGIAVMADLVPTRPVCLTDYPINHISWVLETVLLTLWLGGTLYHRDRFDPAATLTLIESQRLTVWQGAPSMFLLCMEQPEFGTRDLSSVESVLFFGGSLTAASITRLGERTRGARVVTGWGMTETSGGVTLTAPDASVETLATTVGRPHPTVEVLLVDDDGSPVAAGVEGELLVRSATMFQGYHNSAEATAEAIDGLGFLHTGDLAVLQDDGNIRLVGRRSDMFKSGGYNVHPREVELVLEQHPAIVQAAVVATPDALWGEVGVAFVVVDTSRRPPSLEELKTHCARQLANYKIPKAVHLRATLPVLGNGKVHKRALLDGLDGAAAPGATTARDQEQP